MNLEEVAKLLKSGTEVDRAQLYLMGRCCKCGALLDLHDNDYCSRIVNNNFSVKELSSLIEELENIVKTSRLMNETIRSIIDKNK